MPSDEDDEGEGDDYSSCSSAQNNNVGDSSYSQSMMSKSQAVESSIMESSAGPKGLH